MAKVKIQGNASGTGVLTVTAPNTSTDRTITLPDSTGTLLNSDGSGANLTNLPNGSQLDYSGTKTIEATSGGALVGGTAGAKNITVESTSGSGTISLIQLKNAGESFNLEVGRTAGAFTIRDNTNGERLKLDSSGHITMPSQPCFLVNSSSDQTLTLGFDVVTWGTEVFDVGSNFASNTFTAPVTGKYFFQAQVRIDTLDTASDYYYIALRTSNRSKYAIVDPNFSSDLNYYTMSISSVMDMDANDTCDIGVVQNNGTASHLEGSAGYSNFCGYLLG